MWISKATLDELKRELRGAQNKKLWFGPQPYYRVYWNEIIKQHTTSTGWAVSMNGNGIDPLELLCQIANDLGYIREGKEIKPARIRKVAKKKVRKK